MTTFYWCFLHHLTRFKCLNLSMHKQSILQVNYRTSVNKNKCSSSRTETSKILKSYSHFKIGSHSCYVFFCFTLTMVLIMNTSQLVFFFVYRRQSRDRFRIIIKSRSYVYSNTIPFLFKHLYKSCYTTNL